MTNEEMNEMFNKNVNIAYKIANRYRTNYPEEYEDIKQVALLGLWKAIQHYNPKWALSTIAYKTIFNNINFYLRSVKKHKDHDFSMYTVVCTDDKSELTVEDLIPDDTDHIDTMLRDIDIQQAFDRLNLSEIEEEFLDLKKQGLSQREIGENLNRSQAQISRIQTNLRKRFKNNLEGKRYSFTPHQILKPIKPKEEPKVIHKVWIDESNDHKNEIEFFCPETPEENEEFCNRIDDMLEKIRLMSYFQGIQ